jgi:hypothetical protein
MKIIILLFAAVIFLGLLINDAYRVPAPSRPKSGQPLTKQTVSNFNYTSFPTSTLYEQ